MSDPLATQPVALDSPEAESFPSLRLSHLRLLRLSITDRCNFRCCYCVPQRGVRKLRHDDLLSFEELTRLVRWLASETGIHKVRLTGGEPLVRKGIERLIEGLAVLPQIDEIAMTTNATLLAPMANDLKQAGLNRVNVSLDSLDPMRFSRITRGGRLEQTLEGIKVAKEAGLTPIKLNAVLQRSTWKYEVPRLLDFAQGQGLEIRFIELMRTGTEVFWCESEYVSVDEVCRELKAELLPWDTVGSAPARPSLVKWNGGLVKVGWITPRSHPFCGKCERLRMDARGRIRRCLMDPTMFDLSQVLSTSDEYSARNKFREYIAGKFAPVAMDSAFAMSQIGG